MILISSPQYVWALFTQPLARALGATLAELQITFSILIVVQTFLSPWQGVLVDRFGPRVLLAAGVAISGLSWVLASKATTVTALYATYGLLGGVWEGIGFFRGIRAMGEGVSRKTGLRNRLCPRGRGAR